MNWAIGRLECAGVIACSDFRFEIAALRSRTSTVLLIQAQDVYTDFMRTWKYGETRRETDARGRWREVTIRKAVWPAGLPPPWPITLHVTYGASVNESAVDVARRLLTRPRPSELSALMRKHGRIAELPVNAQRSLDQLWEDRIVDLRVERVVGLGPSRANVTISQAERVADAIAAGARLDRRDMNAVELLLTSGPFQFGYWSPIKRIIKHLDPSLAPRAYGVALARLSGAAPEPVAERTFESLNFSVLNQKVNSPATQAYLTRRAVRALHALATRDPRSYVTVASALVAAWDDAVNSRSYLPAYIMGGGKRYRTPDSRRVTVPFDATKSEPAHRGAWLERPDALRSLMTTLGKSAQALTFAYRLTVDCGIDPIFTEDSVAGALESSYAPLVAHACQALPSLPAARAQLSWAAWRAFLTYAQDSSLKDVLGQFQQEGWSSRTWYFTSALAQLVEAGGLSEMRDRLLLGAYASMLLCDSRWAPVPEASAVLLALRWGIVNEEPEVWMTLIERLPAWRITQVLVAASRGNAVTVDSAAALLGPLLVERIPAGSIEGCAEELLQTGDPVLTRLAMAILRKNRSTDLLLRFVTSWVERSDLDLLGRTALVSVMLAETPDEDRAAFVTAVLDEAWGLSADTRIALLLEPAVGPRRIWQLLHEKGRDQIVGLVESSPSLLRAVGDALGERDVPSMPMRLSSLVLDYARNNPERIASDLPFAVALAAYPAADLQDFAIGHIEGANLMPRCWLQLAEIGLPEPGRAVRAWLFGLSTGQQLTDAVIVCLDSPVEACQEVGIDVLGARAADVDLNRVWRALAESRQPAMQRLLASTDVSGAMEDERLAAFDRRVLTARRANRAAKRLIQHRLDRSDAMALAQPARAAALLELARGRNARDREWALLSLTRLADAGHAVEGVVVGMNNGVA